MNRIEAVVFDWAGTMVDFGSCAPVMAMNAAFEEVGVPVAEAAIRRYMGYAKRDHVAALLTEPDVAKAFIARFGYPAADADIDAILARLEPRMAASGKACSALVPGAVATLAWLDAAGIRVGSTTGYTRTMMADIIPAAAAQGYAPGAIVCAGETQQGRPAPFMIWRALEHLGIWQMSATVVVDDAPVGIAAGINAGVWTVAVAASGNGVGLDQAAFTALGPDGQTAAMAPVIADFTQAAADFIIASVADLPAVIDMINDRLQRGLRPGMVAPEVMVTM